MSQPRSDAATAPALDGGPVDRRAFVRLTGAAGMLAGAVVTVQAQTTTADEVTPQPGAAHQRQAIWIPPTSWSRR